MLASVINKRHGLRTRSHSPVTCKLECCAQCEELVSESMLKQGPFQQAPGRGTLLCQERACGLRGPNAARRRGLSLDPPVAVVRLLSTASAWGGIRGELDRVMFPAAASESESAGDRARSAPPAWAARPAAGGLRVGPSQVTITSE